MAARRNDFSFIEHTSAVHDRSIIGIADKIDPQIGVDFFARTRGQTGRTARDMWRSEGTVRAKKMCQDGGTEFISASYTYLIIKDFSCDLS